MLNPAFPVLWPFFNSWVRNFGYFAGNAQDRPHTVLDIGIGTGVNVINVKIYF